MIDAMIGNRFLNALILVGAASSLSACGSIVPSANAPSQAGTERVYAPSATPVTSARPSPILRAEDQSCIANLGQSGARFDLLPDRYTGPGCSTLGAVQLSALTGDTAQFQVTNLGPVQCQVANAFTAWARFGVDRAARQILGSPLARIETMGSYACRNVAGSNRRSAHARAEAVDVSGFVLEDGRRITLTDDWDDGTRAEKEFLRVIQASACRRFGTVLGPDYNRAHEDHFHLEGTLSPSETGFCR